MRSSLEICDVAAGSIETVYQTDRLIEAPNWAPAEDSLVFNGDGRLFRIELRQGAARDADRIDVEGTVALGAVSQDGSVWRPAVPVRWRVGSDARRCAAFRRQSVKARFARFALIADH